MKQMDGTHRSAGNFSVLETLAGAFGGTKVKLIALSKL